MGDHSEAFVAFDTSKLRSAVAIADPGRAGEVRFLGEIENTGTATAKLVKKLAANYAPGVMKDQLDSIAAADSIEKLSGNLGSLLSKQLSTGTGTDAQMLQGLKTVPGLMQSKQGALAMADMIRQTAEKQQQLGYILQDEKNWATYAKTKADFFAKHPVINPLTGNALEMDLKAAQETKTNGGWSIQPVKK